MMDLGVTQLHLVTLWLVISLQQTRLQVCQHGGAASLAQTAWIRPHKCEVVLQSGLLAAQWLLPILPHSTDPV